LTLFQVQFPLILHSEEFSLSLSYWSLW